MDARYEDGKSQAAAAEAAAQQHKQPDRVIQTPSGSYNAASYDEPWPTTKETLNSPKPSTNG